MTEGRVRTESWVGRGGGLLGFTILTGGGKRSVGEHIYAGTGENERESFF